LRKNVVRCQDSNHARNALHVIATDPIIIDCFRPVPELNCVGTSEGERSVADCDWIRARCNLDSTGFRVLAAIDHDLVNDGWEFKFVSEVGRCHFSARSSLRKILPSSLQT
jgi:hypothetical protein